MKPTKSSNTSSVAPVKKEVNMAKRRPSRRAKPENTEEPTLIEMTAATPPKTPPLFLGSIGTLSLPAPEELTGAARRKQLLDESVERARGPGKPADKFRVTLQRDHLLTYPDLWLDVFVAGPQWEEAAFAEMFARAACKKAKSLEDADVVVFTGGPDVDPQFYGAERHSTTHVQPGRDSLDIETYQKCLSLGIPMFGVCRGAQFLWVMNGGKLYQDVDNHNGNHAMFDVRELKNVEKVSSVHHQMCIWDEKLTGGVELLGTSSIARKRWKDPQLCVRGIHADVEAFFIRDICAFGVQGHPEYSGYNFFAKWCLERLNEFVIVNPDVEWKNTRRRLKPSVIDMRDNPLAMPNPKAV